MTIRFDAAEWQRVCVDYRFNWQSFFVGEQGILSAAILFAILISQMLFAPLAWLNCWKVKFCEADKQNPR